MTSDSLYDLSVGGTWSSSNTGVVQIASDGHVTGISGGTSNITYTLPTGCYVTRTVTIHALPVPTVTFLMYLKTLTVPTYYTSYQWYENGVLVPGAHSYNYAVTENGNFYVVVTDTFGCTGQSALVTLNHVGIDEPETHPNVSIYPNPASGWIKIESPVYVKAVISAMDGKVLLEQANAKDVDISQLANGMYVIMVYDETGHRLAVEKLVKQ